MKAFLPVALLVAATIAGCADHPVATGPVTAVSLSTLAETYAGYEIRDLPFVASDGTTLHATAYLPRDPRHGAVQQERFGTIVNLSPYYTNLYGIDTDGRLDAVAAGRLKLNETGTGLFLAHGFAFVAASVPGTGHSGGCFELGGLHEQTVMAEFIDWVGEQPWSNGNVGMTGGSYDGTTQWMAAIHHPVHLKTIVPHVSITDMYNYEYQDGAPYAWWGPFFMPNYLLLVGWNLDPVFGTLPDPDPAMIPQDLCPGVQDHFTEAEKTYLTGVYDDFWTKRNYESQMSRLNASVFLVHGLWDWNVKPLHLDVWDSIPTEKVFWLQQMQHNVPWRDTYKAEYNRPDYNATLLAWYDHYLNGADNGVPGALPAVWTQDHTGLWRTEARWPPATVQATRLYLGDGTLETTAPPAGATTFATAPSYAGAVVEPSVGLSGPTAPDLFVAKFATPPLAQPLRIAGVPHLDLNLSVDRPGYGHIVAEIWDHHADDTWEFLDMGGRGLAQRGDRTQDAPPMPDARLQVPVDLNPTDSYLAAGDRLVVLLSGDNPDWFHPNGNLPTFTLEHGSALSLPTLPAGAPRGVTSQAMAQLNPYYALDPKQY